MYDTEVCSLEFQAQGSMIDSGTAHVQVFSYVSTQVGEGHSAFEIVRFNLRQMS